MSAAATLADLIAGSFRELSEGSIVKGKGEMRGKGCLFMDSGSDFAVLEEPADEEPEQEAAAEAEEAAGCAGVTDSRVALQSFLRPIAPDQFLSSE